MRIMICKFSSPHPSRFFFFFFSVLSASETPSSSALTWNFMALVKLPKIKEHQAAPGAGHGGILVWGFF